MGKRRASNKSKVNMPQKMVQYDWRTDAMDPEQAETYFQTLETIIDKVLPTATTEEPFEDAVGLITELQDYKVDFHREIPLARKFREIAIQKIVEVESENPQMAERLAGLIEDVLWLNARDDFDSYVLFMEWHRPPEKRFYQPRRRVLYPITQHLQDLAEHKIKFLSVSLPPRTGKSTLGIFFMTWMMGRNPNTANVMSGHSDLLTKGFHQEALSIITDNSTYRFYHVFPESKLRQKSMADETINLDTRSRFPSLTCRSIEGTLTGAVEVGTEGVLYMDDLVSDREEALNAARMDKLYSEYNNQLRDRMKDGAVELSVATRWVPNDPIGKIYEEHIDDPNYRFVSIPALDENGESNFKYDYGLGFSTEYYQDMRNQLISGGEEDAWYAKYMQAPYYIGGLLFDRDELNYYDGSLPDGEPDAILAVCDTKDKGKDYACQPVGYVYGNRHYIHDVICDNGLPEIVEPKLASCLARNRVDMCRYESNSAGGRIAEDVAKSCADMGWPIKIDTKFTTTNKETRILVDSQWVKENCYFRSDAPSQDYNMFLRLLTTYTVEGKNKNDDAPDAMSMYKRWATGLRQAKVEAIKRPF